VELSIPSLKKEFCELSELLLTSPLLSLSSINPFSFEEREGATGSLTKFSSVLTFKFSCVLISSFTTLPLFLLFQLKIFSEKEVKHINKLNNDNLSTKLNLIFIKKIIKFILSKK
jgi:hypothetical protein